MFGDPAVRDAKNVAGCEAELFAGRREAEIGACLRAFVDEARGEPVAVATCASIETCRSGIPVRRPLKKATVASFGRMPAGGEGAAALT